MAVPDFTRLNQKSVGAAVGVTARTIQNWCDQGCPRNEDGTYSAPAVVQWLLSQQTTGSEYDTQRERLAAAQAEKVETENRVRRQELAEMSEVAEAWADHIANARSKLLSMPAKLGPQLVNLADPAVIAGRIRQEVYGALVELSESSDVRSSRKADASSEGMASSSGPNGIGLG